MARQTNVSGFHGRGRKRHLPPKWVSLIKFVNCYLIVITDILKQFNFIKILAPMD